MKNENFITIQGWMVNDLDLSGNDLICYALIYGFTQNGNYWDTSLSYISRWLNCNKRTVSNIIDRLCEKGLLLKEEYQADGVSHCRYMATLGAEKADLDDMGGIENFATGYCKNCMGGIEFFSTCRNININNNNKENKKEFKEKEKKTPTDAEKQMFEDFRKQYKGAKRGHDTEFNFFRQQNPDWREILPLLPKAVAKENALRERAKAMRQFFPEPKNLQTYLRAANRGWEAYTADDGVEAMPNEYNPQCDGISLFWNDNAKSYITLLDIDTFADGYKANTRPDGAKVICQGNRYEWSKEQKKWIRL